MIQIKIYLSNPLTMFLLTTNLLGKQSNNNEENKMNNLKTQALQDEFLRLQKLNNTQLIDSMKEENLTPIEDLLLERLAEAVGYDMATL